MQISHTNLEEYVGMQLDILQLLKIRDKSKWLRPKPRKFLIHCIILNSQGVDINSTDAVEELRTRMNFDMNDDVYTYRYKLKRAGWLIPEKEDKKRYKIIPAFDFSNKTIPPVKGYKFNLVYEVQQ